MTKVQQLTGESAMCFRLETFAMANILLVIILFRYELFKENLLHTWTDKYDITSIWQRRYALAHC